MTYFEIEFSDGLTEQWICIKGLEQPTVEEAQQFCAEDSRIFRLPVTGVYPIDEATARNCYDFQGEKDWPIFSRIFQDEDVL